MQREIKKYTTVTFLFRDEKSHEVREHVEGMRFNDWISSCAPVETTRLMGILAQALVLMRLRSDCDTQRLRGIVSPHMLLIDRQDRVKLLDFNDESNYAAARKVQSRSVMRYFAPADYAAMDAEQSEIYGFARLCQYMFAVNEEAGEVMDTALRRRAEHFIDRCMGAGMRPIGQYDKAEAAFAQIRDFSERSSARSRRHAAGAARKVLYAAAFILAAVLLFKKMVYDPHLSEQALPEEQEEIEHQVARLEAQIEQLQVEQEELRSLVD